MCQKDLNTMKIEEIKEKGFSVSRENDPKAKIITVNQGLVTRLNKSYDKLHPLLQLLILMIFVGSQMIFTHFFGDAGYIYWAILTLLLIIFRMIYLFK
jgi:hypothetical protein